MGTRTRANLFFTVLIGVILFAAYAEAGGASCVKPSEGEAVASREDFPWDQSLEEIKTLSKEIYESGKRLPERAYLEDGKLVLPLNELKAEAWLLNFSQISVDISLIEVLKRHVSKIRKHDYASELIYSDIGHAHVFASHEDMDALDKDNVSPDDAEYYEILFASKNTKFLYHTAEQLGTPHSKAEKHRKENRNIIGDMAGEIEVTHFTKTLAGYSQNFTIYLNASHKGCFDLEGENFDISLSSPK